MTYTISSGKLTAKINSFGAELCSLEKEGREYIWQAGDAWSRHAPLLFPFICLPKNMSYKALGKRFKMNANHGFARDMEFALVDSADDYVVFMLEDNIETKAQYPFRFKLYVKYYFEAERLVCAFRVMNPSDKIIYFYLGGHPAFNCPLEEGLCFNDYYVEYENAETIEQVIPDGKRTILQNEKRLPLTRELFDFDVIMKDKPLSKAVSIKSDKGEGAVTVFCPQSDCIAVWSPAGNNDAAFVCIEPWTSVPVYCDDDNEDIEHKKHAISLQAGEYFDYRYDIEVR